MVYRNLDRALVDVYWCITSPDAYVEVLCTFHSDHNLILLKCGLPLQDQGLHSFRFEAAWITNSEYSNIVQTAWGKSPYGIVTFLQNVKHDSILFNKETFGNISTQKHNIEKRLKGIQHSLERINLTRLVYFQQELQQDCDEIFAQEEILCGVWCNDDTVFKVEELTFFKGLFRHTSYILTASMSDSIMALILTEEAQNSLTRQVKREEVTYVLNQMHHFKEPGPDGFQDGVCVHGFAGNIGYSNILHGELMTLYHVYVWPGNLASKT
ncbi:hypothetical protein KIW84_043051 [Lathyrus oleraceus]|uniref:Uncharacterized protein n=1 Tax=Pisum sativum TaxID=3888 RepID=A0A9D5ATX5_PEA|nr:hypothetical protein KIW84_043051 [Pisum sativum]